MPFHLVLFVIRNQLVVVISLSHKARTKKTHEILTTITDDHADYGLLGSSHEHVLRLTHLIDQDTSHYFQAGLYALDDGMSLWDILENPDKISRQLAEQKPLWEPGKKHRGHQVKPLWTPGKTIVGSR